jgi:hypothetical protein
MSERDQRGRVVKALKHLDAISVENRVLPGTPDVEYIGGWVELKWIRSWPRNSDVSPVHVDHFTPQQRVWLKRRWRRGGRAFVLLQAGGQDWLLLDGETAAQCLGRATRKELYIRALITWKGLNEKELATWLTMDLDHLHQRRLTTLTALDEAKRSGELPSD